MKVFRREPRRCAFRSELKGGKPHVVGLLPGQGGDVNWRSFLSMHGLTRPTQDEGLAGENATNESRLVGQEAFHMAMPTLGLGFAEDA